MIDKHIFVFCSIKWLHFGCDRKRLWWPTAISVVWTVARRSWSVGDSREEEEEEYKYSNLFIYQWNILVRRAGVMVVVVEVVVIQIQTCLFVPSHHIIAFSLSSTSNHWVLWTCLWSTSTFTETHHEFLCLLWRAPGWLYTPLRSYYPLLSSALQFNEWRFLTFFSAIN